MTVEGPRSLEHGLTILEAFTVESPMLGVSELSRILGLTKSTVHRLVTTLVKRGYLIQDDDSRKYSLSLRMYQVGCLAVQELGLFRIASILEELGARTRETVHISVLTDTAVTYLHSVESPQPIKTRSRLGQCSPVTCTANGKLFLAHLAERARQAYLWAGLPRYTDNTITEMHSFERELESIRLQGYALDREELQEGIVCIAAPIRDHTQSVVAALGLSAPALRMSTDRIGELSSLLVDAAGRASRELGFMPKFAATSQRDAAHSGTEKASQLVSLPVAMDVQG